MLPPSIEYKYGVTPLNDETVIPPLHLVPVLQQQVIQSLKKRPKLIVMDTMNFWMDIAMDDLKKTIAMKGNGE